MIKVKPLDASSEITQFFISDIVGISKARGDEIANLVAIILDQCLYDGLTKPGFVNKVIDEVTVTTQEEQAFLFMCIGQAV